MQGDIFGRYTIADLKISLYVCVHTKIKPSKIRILNPKNSQVGILELYTRKVCGMFVYEDTETTEYVKK